jgi:hypothetical protein
LYRTHQGKTFSADLPSKKGDFKLPVSVLALALGGDREGLYSSNYNSRIYVREAFNTGPKFVIPTAAHSITECNCNSQVFLVYLLDLTHSPVNPVVQHDDPPR